MRLYFYQDLINIKKNPKSKSKLIYEDFYILNCDNWGIICNLKNSSSIRERKIERNLSKLIKIGGEKIWKNLQTNI